MADKTAIEWTDATWNPIVGCSIVSPGCTNCYAMKMAARLQRMNRTSVNHYDGTTMGRKSGAVWTGKVALAPEKLFRKPISWKTPRRIFVNSMGDLFHESVPDEWIDRVFAVMALAPQHTFQVLTKRAERMWKYCSTIQKNCRWLAMEDVALSMGFEPRGRHNDGFDWLAHHQCLQNVWLGVSTEDQPRADERIPHLLATPAAKRFISAEPLLGPVDIRAALVPPMQVNARTAAPMAAISTIARAAAKKFGNATFLDWVIAGGESGPNARPMHPDWARSLRGQCQAAGVPFFFKQWGEWVPTPRFDDLPGSPQMVRAGDLFITRDGRQQALCDDLACEFEIEGTPLRRVGKKAAGALLDGREWREIPA